MFETKCIRNLKELDIYSRHPFAGYDKVRIPATGVCAHCGRPAVSHFGRWFDGKKPWVYKVAHCSESCYNLYFKNWEEKNSCKSI